MVDIFDKLWAAGNLLLDTFLTLVDISRMAEDDLDRELEAQHYQEVTAEDQEHLREIRKKAGIYKINNNGKWVRDLGFANDLIFLGRDPERDD
jgi:hypothetical protein